jgi:Leucine-rich repeat (LRR) protein
MEIYLSNNCLEEIREIMNLKNLSRLIILDLSGNSLAKDPHFRIYSIFHTKKLKVLNGIPIESNEQHVAREMFVGRLTEEILESRLNGYSLKEVKILDLSNAKLKDFDDIFTSKNFPKLRELNLSNNYFGSMRIFGSFPSLKILSLNRNRIETLLITHNV